ILEEVQPESPDNSAAMVAGCIGVALGLLDESGRDPDVPAGLARQRRLPAGHWFGERAGTDVLALAGKGKAFRSLDRVLARRVERHGGPSGADAGWRSSPSRWWLTTPSL